MVPFHDWVLFKSYHFQSRTGNAASGLETCNQSIQRWIKEFGNGRKGLSNGQKWTPEEYPRKPAFRTVKTATHNIYCVICHQKRNSHNLPRHNSAEKTPSLLPFSQTTCGFVVWPSPTAFQSLKTIDSHPKRVHIRVFYFLQPFILQNFAVTDLN